MTFPHEQIHDLQQQLTGTRPALIPTRLVVRDQKQELMEILALQEQKHISVVENEQIDMVTKSRLKWWKRRNTAVSRRISNLLKSWKRELIKLGEAERQEGKQEVISAIVVVGSCSAL